MKAANSATYGATLRKLRVDLGLSAEEVAGLIGVTTRIVSSWESGSQPMPHERLELLTMKLERRDPSVSMVAVFDQDKVSFLDVVSERNFVGLQHFPDDTASIHSLAIERATGKPFVQVTTFNVEGNERVILAAREWERAKLSGQPTLFSPSDEAGVLALNTWLTKRVVAAIERNPLLRELRDRVSAANLEVKLSRTEEERRRNSRALDEACTELIRAAEIGTRQR